MLIIMPKKFFFVAKSLFGPISLTQKNKIFLNKFASIFSTSKFATRKILREFINTSIFEMWWLIVDVVAHCRCGGSL